MEPKKLNNGSRYNETEADHRYREQSTGYEGNEERGKDGVGN